MGSDFVNLISKKFLKWVGGGTLAIGIAVMLIISIAVVTVVGAVSNESTRVPPTWNYMGLSADVESYRDMVTHYCEQAGIPEYVDLALAVMQQESGGKGLDPMQSSECSVNTRYPNIPGGIIDPEYSVYCGVTNLANCLKAAKVSAPDDIDNISLALQGYNFGNGYIAWAQERGGYTAENAVEFSNLQANRLGWAQYGDVEYVPHVLRYYALAGTMGDGYLAHPLQAGSYTISSQYGARTDPSPGFHYGIDFAAGAGTPIFASETGTVQFAGFGNSKNGYADYGYVVVIHHGNNCMTLYAHCSDLYVMTGELVQKGQSIAAVGNTGRSTGNHLHFELRIDGERIDPTPYLQQQLPIYIPQSGGNP